VLSPQKKEYDEKKEDKKKTALKKIEKYIKFIKVMSKIHLI